MDFDDMLEELGELGKFQITTYTLICLPVLFAAANSLSYVFTAGVPDYRCHIQDCDNEHSVYNEVWLPSAIPDEGRTHDKVYKAAKCERFVRNISAVSESSDYCPSDWFTKDVERCNEWVFDPNERTIVNDWNITCLENHWMLSLVGSCHFAGIIVGSAVFGFLADRYGRKLVFIFCIVLMSISGVLQVFSPEYVTFATLVFINALGTAGVYPLAFIIGVEMVGRKKREVTGMILNYFYAIGEALVALIAWITKDWIWLQLSVSAPAILFIAYYWIIPESVRWLLAKEENIKAKGIVCRVAKMNKVVLSESLLQSFNEESKDGLKLQEPKAELNSWHVLKTMMKSRKLVIRFSIVFFIWAVNAFVFYGLSVNSTSIGGDKYLNFALVSLVEIPGYSLAWIAIHKFGRRPALIGSLLTCGITCSVTIFVPQESHWAIVLLFLIGKLAVTSAFGVVYVHTSEMLPTVIRSGVVGAASTMARVGALLAPFVPLLGVYYPSLPLLLFGAVAIIAGLMAFKLPETLGIKLPETVQDAQRI